MAFYGISIESKKWYQQNQRLTRKISLLTVNGHRNENEASRKLNREADMEIDESTNALTAQI